MLKNMRIWLRKHRKEVTIAVFVLDMLALGWISLSYYAPAYQEAVRVANRILETGTYEAQVLSRYNYVSAVCLVILSLLNFFLLIAFWWQELEQDIQKDEMNHAYAKVLEEKNNEIMRYAKITSVGRVVTDIIHQWKQPLNRLMLIISNMEGAIEEDENYLEEILELSREAKGTIRFLSDTISEFRNVLTYEGKSSAFEFDEAMRYVIEIFNGRIRENNVECIIEYEGNLRIFGKKNMLIQTLMNLVDNALDAIDSRTGPKAMEQGVLKISGCELVEGIRISIWDNGGEIQAQDLEKIFQLYYSSKKEKGSGLGLAISRNIIQKNFGGSLTAQNTDGGAEFVIFLPRYGEKMDE